MIVEAARGWLGVPYQHQGRTMAGVDCVGLGIAVAHQLGLSQYDITGYSRNPSGQRRRRLLREHCTPVDLAEIRAGDILHLRFGAEPQHLAVVTRTDPTYILHADSLAGRVVEHILDPGWRAMCRGAYRL